MKLTEANHAIRRRNVSASEVGALLGDHPWTTPAAIWDRLNGIGPEREQTEAMAIGSALEPVILELAANKLRTRLRANGRTYVHPRVRLCATPDALVLPRNDAERMMYGNALVELKASGSRDRWRDPTSGGPGLPADVEWQCRAQMACTHRDRVIVVVLVGVALHVFTVERNYGPERRMTRAVQAFWTDYVETGIRPQEAPRRETSKAYLPGGRPIARGSQSVSSTDGPAVTDTIWRVVTDE